MLVLELGHPGVQILHRFDDAPVQDVQERRCGHPRMAKPDGLAARTPPEFIAEHDRLRELFGLRELLEDYCYSPLPAWFPEVTAVLGVANIERRFWGWGWQRGNSRLRRYSLRLADGSPRDLYILTIAQGDEVDAIAGESVAELGRIVSGATSPA